MKALSLWKSSVLFLLLAAATPATAALDVVHTSNDIVQCTFDNDCTLVYTDRTSAFLSNSYVQSRYVKGAAGSVAAGKWLYVYRIDMTSEVGALSIPYTTSLRIPFKGLLRYDFDFNGEGDDVFNISIPPPIGTKGVTSATQSVSGAITFNFSTIYGGSFPGDGESSYYFGVVSSYGPRAQYATVNTSSGAYTVVVWAPYGF